MFLPLFHLSVVALDAYTLWYDQNYVTLPIEHKMKKQLEGAPFKGRFLFLTIWCLVVQTLYFTLALLNDLIGNNERSPKKPPVIRVIKDTLFSLAFPAAVFVCIAFWGIFYYNSELILPQKVREVFPDWVNHSMHTTIVPFVILEAIFNSITYPSKGLGLFIGISFVFSYIGLLALIYFKSGSLVYPVFEVMTIPMKVGFILGGAIFGLSLYFVCEFFCNLANPKAKEVSKSPSKVSGKKKSKKV